MKILKMKQVIHNAEDIADAVDNAMSVLSSWEIGYWFVLKYGKQWYPGCIRPPGECDEVVEDGFYLVCCMERKQYGINCFRWPAVPDIDVYHRDDLLLQIKELTPVNTEILSSVEIVRCVRDEADFNGVDNALKRALREE